MNRPWPRLSLCAMLLGCASGCLFVTHSTHVVREEEPIRPFRFESEEAKAIFEAGVRQMQAHKDGSSPQFIVIPFLCWYSRVNQLSDNAIYNDQAAVCDGNADSFITLQEAAGYLARVNEKLASARRAKAATGETKVLETVPLTQQQPDPPGLFHISSR